MKIRTLLTLIITLGLTSCGVQWKYTALNYAGQIDGIYSSNDFKVDTLNEFQFRNKLRTDFNFRYDFAQYALSQPASFDWNNRLLGNRYNWNRPYLGYSYYWNRNQMWNDWVWGYPYSYWGYNNWNSWNRPLWGWNNSRWNSYNSWYQGPWNNPIYNVMRNYSRRGNIRTTCCCCCRVDLVGKDGKTSTSSRSCSSKSKNCKQFIDSERCGSEIRRTCYYSRKRNGCST